MKKSILQPTWTKSSKSDRFKQLEEFFYDKDVLDIGCAVGYKRGDWMHKAIKDKSRTIFGLDLDVNAVREIKENGYDVEFGDAQNFSLSKRFNLIHAGELLEHLSNPSGFLQAVKRHLTVDGVLLLTTPNALRISNFVYAASGGLRVNAEHTCWYCEYTLSTLLEREGFKVKQLGYIKHTTINVWRRMALKFRTMILPKKVAFNTLFVVAEIK